MYLSKYINKTKQEYYKLFNKVRDNNNFEDWILYILKGIEITSKETIELIANIQTEIKNYKEEFRSKLPKIYSKELLESLFYEVYTKISYKEEKQKILSKLSKNEVKYQEELSKKYSTENLFKNTVKTSDNEVNKVNLVEYEEENK